MISRDLYTDLLIKILSNTIYEDPAMEPGSNQAFSKPARDVGKDWPRIAHTMVGTRRLTNLRDLAQSCLDRGISGDFIETGVWRGGCCILMRGVLAANGEKSRKVYVADSFAGLPPPKPDVFSADAGDPHHTFSELVVSLDQVKANFEKYGLLDGQVVFVEGWFENTLPRLDAGPFALIRLDGDMYESTIVALNSLYAKLTSGGYLIVDDYGAIEGCRRAVEDFRARHSIASQMHVIDWTGVWWQKD